MPRSFVGAHHTRWPTPTWGTGNVPETTENNTPNMQDGGGAQKRRWPPAHGDDDDDTPSAVHVAVCPFCCWCGVVSLSGVVAFFLWRRRIAPQATTACPHIHITHHASILSPSSVVCCGRCSVRNDDRVIRSHTHRQRHIPNGGKNGTAAALPLHKPNNASSLVVSPLLASWRQPNDDDDDPIVVGMMGWWSVAGAHSTAVLVVLHTKRRRR